MSGEAYRDAATGTLDRSAIDGRRLCPASNARQLGWVRASFSRAASSIGPRHRAGGRPWMQLPTCIMVLEPTGAMGPACQCAGPRARPYQMPRAGHRDRDLAALNCAAPGSRGPAGSGAERDIRWRGRFHRGASARTSGPGAGHRGARGLPLAAAPAAALAPGTVPFLVEI